MSTLAQRIQNVKIDPRGAAIWNRCETARITDLMFADKKEIRRLHNIELERINNNRTHGPLH